MTNQIHMPESPEQEKVLPPVQFSVELTDFVESVGIGLVSTERAQRLVPPEVKLLNTGEPVTPLVVLAARGKGIAVAGTEARAGAYVQIGLLIVPPDGTGEINIFMLWHFTTHALLARSLRGVGLNSQHLPTISYALTLGGKAGSTQVIVPAPAQPTLTLAGAIREPDQPISFVGNWWAKAGNGLLKMNSTVPEAMVSDAQLTLTTEPNSALGHLIGGATLGFAALQRFNTFKQARTDVSLYSSK